MKTGYDVILRPIITENSMDMAAEKKYAFKVAKEANKTEVRKAIEDAITAIEAIQDFENTAKGNPQVKAAIDQVSALEEVLNKEVLPLLSK